MFKFIKRFIQEVRGQARLAQEMQFTSAMAVPEEMMVQVAGESYKLLYHPHLLNSNAVYVAGAATLTDGTQVIIVDSYFRQLSLRAQHALLHHEVGHFKHNHHAKNEGKSTAQMAHERNMAGIFGVHQDELEADAWAASIVGPKDLIHALEEISTLVGFMSTEAHRRIKILNEQ